MVNLFQFLVFICDWQLNFPENGLRFLSKVRFLVLMDFLPTENSLAWLSDKLGFEVECEGEDCDEPFADKHGRLLSSE